MYDMYLFFHTSTSQAPPKQVPKTIESMRVYDETMVNPQDSEVGIALLSSIHGFYILLLTSPTSHKEALY